MSISCVVSFAPGTGGHFIGAVCQHLLHGDEIKILSNGSCHNNNLINLGAPDLVIENSGESICHELVTIKKKITPSHNNVVVTHSRNIWALSEKFDKVVYINFSENDVGLIYKKYKEKNANIPVISQVNYDHIKDPSWPSYQDFMNGLGQPYMYEEVNNSLSRDMFHSWVWIIPALQNLHNIYKIDFSSIFNQRDDWYAGLVDFLGLPPDFERFKQFEESYQRYLRLQK